MIGVAILGYGVVGSGVATMLLQNHDLIEQAVGQPLRLTHVVELRDVKVPHGVILTQSFDDVLKSDAVRVVAETIGGVRAAYEFTKRALESGRHVVTSNKELVTEHGDELCAIALEKNVMYLFEASVGGGIPVLRPISQCLSGNRLTRIDGIVNGSTNYLLTRMAEDGVSFPAALGEARELGYVEENPAADVEGWDARRKLAILAHMAFGSMFSDNVLIPTEGIQNITEGEIQAAEAFHMAVKLIAHGEREGAHWRGWVNPAAVPKKSPLYNVNQAFNAIMLRGNFVDDVMFYGPGAGSFPTASAVVGDLIEVGQHIDAPRRKRMLPDCPSFLLDDRSPARYLFRISGKEEAAIQAVRAALLGAQTRVIERGVAVLTPERPQAELDEALAALFKQGVKMGVFLRVME